MMELSTTEDERSEARALLAAGYILVGVSLGLVIGFWASDWGARFVPQTAVAALALLLLAVLFVTAALRISSGSFDRRARVAMSASGFILLILALVLVTNRPTALTSMADIDLRRTQELDARYYRDLDRTLRGLVARFETGLSPSSTGAPDLLTEADEAFALDTWESYLNTAMALDRVRRFHEDFYRFDLSRFERSAHIRSFLVSFASELSLYQNTSELLGVIRSRPSLSRFLSLERADRGIALDSVAFVDEELTGLTDLSRVSAGRRYLAYLDTFHEGRALTMGEGLEWLWDDVERYVAIVEARSSRSAVAASASSDFAPVLRSLKHITFPVQRGVAEWMGDTRLKRSGHYLIAAEQAREAERELEPGDVLLARKNWYLSNVGLPGFWPHAILYVGTPDALAKAFDDDPAVRDWIRVSAGRPIAFTEWLAERYPVAWELKTRAASGDEPLALIEAVSEGVVQSSLVHASGDFLVALRPRLPAVVKAKAIDRAFSFLNRPYDFDFDFATDDALVCTEVVWRAYRAESVSVSVSGRGGGADGLRVEPVTIAGRSTLPANELARLFVSEREREDAQFDFVLYIEGDEERGVAERRGLESFLGTVDRSKWGS